jgi:transposase
LKTHIKEWALAPTGFHMNNDDAEYDISAIDEQMYYDCVFYKERWMNENGIEQRIIVSYSPKHKNYQREVRQRQIDRAVKIIEGGNKLSTRNLNSPSRFIEEIQTTEDGELAKENHKSLNLQKIADEEQYDGFYAVCTNLEDDVHVINKINKRRWEIEESFRIMKSEFKARPVYVQKDEHIRAHFMTCFLSLMVFRLLEKKLDDKYTVAEIIDTLKSMRFQKIKGIGYMPCYTRTEITDALHDAFSFRTDKQFLSDKKMKEIIRNTKK